MKDNMTRKDFLKTGLLGFIGALSFSKFGSIITHAAVSDNTGIRNITNDQIKVDKDGIFKSGQSAKKLADCVNNTSSNLGNISDAVAVEGDTAFKKINLLNESFLNVDTILKSTPLVSALDVVSSTIFEIIEKIKTIAVFSKQVFTAKNFSEIQIPDGYYYGDSSVQIADAGTLTPLTAGKFSTVKSDGSGIYSSVDISEDTEAYKTIYESGKSIGTKNAKQGTAVADDVLNGKTFTNESGINLAGAMPNNGAWSKTATDNGTIAIPKGFHDGTGKVTVNIAKDSTVGKSISAQAVSEVSKRAGTSWNYRGGTSEYSLGVNGVLKNSNLIVVTSADNTTNISDTGIRVSSGSVTEVEHYSDWYSGNSGMSFRMKIYKWTTNQTSGTVTVTIANRGTCSTSYVAIYN